MLSYIWGFLVISSILYGGYQGATFIGTLSSGMLDSAGEAISLGIVMLGVVGMWNGIINIAIEAGLIGKLSKLLNPALSFLFPSIPTDSPVRMDIATNMISNILGLGWAATPAGLKAMKGLQQLAISSGTNYKTGYATNEMCTLLVINISSLQLIPINIIAYRTEYASINPTSIVGPGIIATLVSTFVAVIFCKACSRDASSVT